MTEVVDLDARRPHQAGPARCLHCGHEWAQVSLQGLMSFECPVCGLSKGVWVGIVRPMDDECIYECKCGNAMYFVLEDGIQCVCCGARSPFP